MIRGSIELATPDTIQGWIHTSDGRIREHTLLAFQGDQCVGAGKVNTFRGDLADAGIGDGHLGFSFPISVLPERVGQVVLKLEGSDAMLLQTGARVAGETTGVAGLPRAEVRARLAALKWALKHGRIGQGDFDFLRILWSFGVYERGLLRRNAGEEAVVAEKSGVIAAALLESYAGTDVRLSSRTVRSPAEFQTALAEIAAGPVLKVVALHTETRASLRVAEGTHVEDVADAPVTDYPLTPDHLLILDVRARAELQMAAGASVEILSAEPALS
ncbi:hypothetical protein [Aureimonas jatrophae]|uniref:Uncharacterized protein n=1 Tax=Aureimonas jatrophae TaxID=1166073 RepID=A0A1H0F2Q2_9HYPH|nr:hypothetical protein [Aureimonas jatrophae]MBB3950207.1 hypothetical protein [Aureimonas jatrophae]SDN88885.1 hypothetical protein SAMN05192530_102329 [Aureimonas jatrophae]